MQETLQIAKEIIQNNKESGEYKTGIAKSLVSANRVSTGFSVKDVQLAVMMRKTAVRSLWVQMCGRICRAFPGKEYAELLDIANNTAEFGFANEEYFPPKKGDKAGLDKEKERLQAKEIMLIAQEEPTEINRALVLDKIEELKAKAKKIPQLDFKDLLAIYETSQDPRQIIEIGYDIDRRKTGKSYQSTQVDWASQTWSPFIDEFPEYKSRILRTLKSRIKNLVSQGKKVSSIHYFPKFLKTVPPYMYVQEPPSDINVEFNVDMDDQRIPF